MPVSTSSPTDAPPPSAREEPPLRVHVVKGWRRLPASLAGLLVRVWCASLRFRASGKTAGLAGDASRPTLFVLWHNRLFVAAEISHRFRPSRPLHGLVSTSKDGALLAAFFESVGLRVVRGSSSRGGREAASGLVDVLRAGKDAGITPDGPRGPAYVCKPGAVVVARRARARVLLVGIHYENWRELGSWDRFRLPMPFTTVRVEVELVDESAIADERAREHIEARLRALNADPAEAPRAAI